MIKYIFLVLLIFGFSTSAQEIDTVKIQNISDMETQIDSLRKIIRVLDTDLQYVKRNMVEGKTDVDEILALLNNEDVESANADSRSRRKRVDAILQAITQRPGKLQFNGGATAILNSGNNKIDNFSVATGSFDIYAHTSFGNGTLLFFDLEAIGGNGLDDYFNTFNGVNGDAGSTQDNQGIDRLNILEAWAEFSLFENLFTVTAGKIDLTNYFDNNASANDETMQFMTNDFVNSGAFAVPANSPGIRFKTTIDNRFHLQFGFASAINSGKDIFDSIYKIAGIGYTFFPGSDFESNIRVYGFMHPLADNTTGWGISFDEVLFGAYNIFARYGMNEDKVAEYWGVKSSWSAGTRFVTKILDQSTVFGLAYGSNKAISTTLKPEQLLEIYARVQLNKWTHISPHFQNIWNGAGGEENYTIFGIRTHFNF